MTVRVHAVRTYEEQLRLLGTLTARTVPRLASGRNAFFQDVSSWYSGFGDQKPNQYVVPPDPSYVLIFPYPRDDLSLGMMTSDIDAHDAELASVARKYRLTVPLLQQQTRTLSGGERLLVALAKASVSKTTVDGLVMCSPTRWLFRKNFECLEQLAAEYRRAGKSVDVIMLAGEALPAAFHNGNGHPPPDTARSDSTRESSEATVRWGLRFDEIIVEFPGTDYPVVTPAKRLTYRLHEPFVRVDSPTLLVGDNGIGKSTFAKVLTGQLRPLSRRPEVELRGIVGSTRCVFQDSLDQLFGESIRQHMDRVFRFDSDGKKRASTMFDEMQTAIVAEIGDDDLVIGNRDEPNTVLQSKLALIAERLAGRPVILALDEPEWGLSRDAARALLRVVAQQAAKNQTAILVISHAAEWWRGIACSTLEMSREKSGVIRVRSNVHAD